MWQKLLKLANQLDQKGLYEEASIIDNILKEATSCGGGEESMAEDDPMLGAMDEPSEEELEDMYKEHEEGKRETPTSIEDILQVLKEEGVELPESEEELDPWEEGEDYADGPRGGQAGQMATLPQRRYAPSAQRQQTQVQVGQPYFETKPITLDVPQRQQMPRSYQPSQAQPQQMPRSYQPSGPARPRGGQTGQMAQPRQYFPGRK